MILHRQPGFSHGPASALPPASCEPGVEVAGCRADRVAADPATSRLPRHSETVSAGPKIRVRDRMQVFASRRESDQAWLLHAYMSYGDAAVLRPKLDNAGAGASLLLRRRAPVSRDCRSSSEAGTRSATTATARAGKASAMHCHWQKAVARCPVAACGTGRAWSGCCLPPSPRRYEDWHGEGKPWVVEKVQERREVTSGDQPGIDGLVSRLQQVRALDRGTRAGAGSENEPTFGAGLRKACTLHPPWERPGIRGGVCAAAVEQFAERVTHAVERALLIGRGLGTGREELSETLRAPASRRARAPRPAVRSPGHAPTGGGGQAARG
jgi:hypothetical protein